MSMIARGRAARARLRIMWLAAAGIVAGCGIWGLHFIAMLAYRSGLPVAYDVWLTALSAAIAMSLCATGFVAAFTRAGPAVGGGIAGAAICAMHYTGMAAVRIPAHASWNATYVVASLLIGILLTAAALQIALTRRNMRGYAVGAALFAIGVVGLHFTAMTAVVFTPDPTVAVSGVVMEPSILAVAVAAAVILIMALGLIGAILDHHLAARATREAARLRAHISRLEATQAELEQTSKELRAALDSAALANQAKSQFLATMSHELRTPLNAVIGFSEMMAGQAFGPLGHPRYREYAADIRSSGAHLLALINDILDLSRLDAGQVELHEEALDPAELVEEAVRMVRGQAEAGGLALRETIPPALPGLQADRRRVRQILVNLLSNAVKFTPAKGRIAVAVFMEGAELGISVSDTGIGMAPAHIGRALERFGQVDNSLSRKYEGAGLGLPIAKQLMELHGGRFQLESALDAGTTVTLFFPAERTLSEAAAPGVLAQAC